MRAALLGLCAAAGCAHAPEPVTRVEAEWVQPQVDETAVRAARKCLTVSLERIVEIELSTEGRARAFLLPPGPPEEQACADGIALGLHAQPSQRATRSLQRGDGKMEDPASPRARSLALRARAIAQSGPARDCFAAFQSRVPPSRHRKPDRVGVLLEVSDAGAITRAEAASATVDEAGVRCVAAAARALALPPIPGTYRYPYLYAPPLLAVGNADTNPVDPTDVTAAISALTPAAIECVSGYRVAGTMNVLVTPRNDGSIRSARVERAVGTDGEEPADQCLTQAALRLRFPPFDGDPPEIRLPFLLR